MLCADESVAHLLFVERQANPMVVVWKSSFEITLDFACKQME